LKGNVYVVKSVDLRNGGFILIFEWVKVKVNTTIMKNEFILYPGDCQNLN
jgi:hypothetical protein